jgi:ParB-like nuclease domain
VKVRIDHLDANPFRHIDRYPIREDKITALRESITKTGFWDNMVGRQVGDRVQIAYGHHRREALLREYPADYEVGIVLRDFDDESMLQIMARENMEEWGSSAAIEMETVRSVVEAYGAGQIGLTPPPAESRRYWRIAPSFSVANERGPEGAAAPYTAKSVAEFLGWVQKSGEPQKKVENAIAALDLIEQGHLKDNDFFGMSTKQAEALVQETRRSVQAAERARQEADRAAALAEQRRRDEAERAKKAAQEREEALARARAAKEKADQDRAEREYQQSQRAAEEAEQRSVQAQRVADEVRKRNAQSDQLNREETRKVSQAAKQHLKSGGGYKDVRSATDKVRRQTRDEAPRDLGKEVRGLASAFSTFLSESTMARRLNMVLGFRRHIADADLGQLISGLEMLQEDIEKVLNKLGANSGVVNKVSFSDAGPVAALDREVIDGDVLDAEVV